MTASIFITANDYINSQARGGVQWCTQDYLSTLRAGGWEPEVLGFDSDQRLLTKLLRRLAPCPFKHQVLPSFIKSVIQQCMSSSPIIFLNNASALSLAPALRARLGNRVRLVFLSHGAENTDLINALWMHPAALPRHMRQPLWLGRLMFEELRQRKAIDLVVCISEQDVLFEQCLGTPQALFLPRTIISQPISPRCIRGRLGTVATLNHGPNRDGIEQLAAKLVEYPELRLRVVGGPPGVGKQLQQNYSSIEYLGPLSDGKLHSEVATWCGFANPIFCQARGASTKVATALGWGMPVLTTPTGSRGYLWNDDLIPRPQTDMGLAKLCAAVGLGDTEDWWRKADALRSLAPSFEECGKRLANAVSEITSEGYAT